MCLLPKDEVTAAVTDKETLIMVNAHKREWIEKLSIDSIHMKEGYTFQKSVWLHLLEKVSEKKEVGPTTKKGVKPKILKLADSIHNYRSPPSSLASSNSATSTAASTWSRMAPPVSGRAKCSSRSSPSRGRPGMG